MAWDLSSSYSQVSFLPCNISAIQWFITIMWQMWRIGVCTHWHGGGGVVLCVIRHQDQYKVGLAKFCWSGICTRVSIHHQFNSDHPHWQQASFKACARGGQEQAIQWTTQMPHHKNTEWTGHRRRQCMMMVSLLCRSSAQSTVAEIDFLTAQLWAMT